MQRECPLNRSHYIRYNFNAAQAPPQNFCDPQDHTLFDNPLCSFGTLPRLPLLVINYDVKMRTYDAYIKCIHKMRTVPLRIHPGA